MAKFTCSVNVGEQVYKTYKMAAAITDNDIGKPVTYPAASDVVALAADGEQIYGFVAAVEPATADGLKIVSILVEGRAWVILDGNSAVGTIVEAAANTVAGTAKAGAFGLVSTHTLVAGTMKQWMIISGTGLDGATVLVEKI
ncbi:hypothetical protein GW915_14210 [bacterium]|nr:hypothetical protein [bacterium]